MNTELFFDNLWQDYINMTPQAEAIHTALTKRGETVRNDHVAFRTFNQGPIRLERLEPFILELGYERFEPYHFAGKKLDAWGYIHPDARKPRIFLSELRVEELSERAQGIIQGLIGQIDASAVADPSIFWRGPLWAVPSWEDYQALAEESEYAAWLSVIGLRCNHFTIDVNALNSINSIEAMNHLVEDLGYTINSSGGRVKGSPAVLLEQASTKASVQPFTFADGAQHDVTTCYYEFAKRYLDDNGQLYQGFVAASADKIFESTDMRSSMA
ncbi:MAG: 2-oxoadipate dioxygenase/decarboxylase family protein [Saccharospirillum sp.]